jgi:phosphomannomutase
MVCIIEQHSAGKLYKIPLTGHFIQYRGSMINWCPIGRNAQDFERKQFIEFDNSSSPTYRSLQLSRLKHKLSIHGVDVTVKFGGDTSFDIYPIGWDKTFCLRHFKNKVIWFVGDRCGTNGNDKEIYDLLKSENRSFETENPEITKVIIENKILVQI